jgi:secondary thiamine-phosphate synthase enzyme
MAVVTDYIHLSTQGNADVVDIPLGNYHHDDTWNDGNGHSHLRASLVGPSLTLPFTDAELMLGTWQQIIFIDFDVRSRKREIILQFLGE